MTFKTDVRKTVETVSSRNSSYWKNFNLQACVFSARFMVVFTMKLYLLKRQGLVPCGQRQKSCLGTEESRLPPLCTPLIWGCWGYPHHLSDEPGRLVGRAESTAGVPCLGGKLLRRWQSARLALHLQSSGQELTAWCSLLSQVMIHQRTSIFLYWFIESALESQLPYYRANEKCFLIQYYLRFKTGGDSDLTLPCYSI